MVLPCVPHVCALNSRGTLLRNGVCLPLSLFLFSLNSTPTTAISIFFAFGGFNTPKKENRRKLCAKEADFLLILSHSRFFFSSFFEDLYSLATFFFPRIALLTRCFIHTHTHTYTSPFFGVFLRLPSHSFFLLFLPSLLGVVSCCTLLLSFFSPFLSFSCGSTSSCARVCTVRICFAASHPFFSTNRKEKK